MMATHDITGLRNSSQVRSVQRGVEYDWIVIAEPGDGPAPNVAEVFADHTDEYELAECKRHGDETFAHFAEVDA